MNWKCIRLELGSTGEFPAGSVGRAYLVRLPLDDFDIVDTQAFVQNPARATVRRYWSTEADQRGLLAPSGTNWAMRCSDGPRLLQLDSKPVRIGQRVSVVEPDGTILPFNITSVR